MVDLSPSLDFGTAACEKRDLAVAALAAVAHLTARRRQPDRRGGAPPASRPVRIPARGGLAHARGLLRKVAADPARARGHPRRPRRGGRAAAPAAAAARAGRGGLRLPRRARVGAAAARAVRRGTSCSPIEVLDPRELELPEVGHRRAGRPGDRPAARGGRPRRCCAGSSPRPPPRTATGWRRRCAAAGAAHLRLRTDRDWIADIVRFVARPASARWSGGVAGEPGDLRPPVVAAAARRRRRAGRRLRRAAAPAPARHRARSPTWSCSTGRPAAARAGRGTCRRPRCSLALALLTVALAGPDGRGRVPRNRATVMLVIDVSLSMQATDVRADPAGRRAGGGEVVRRPADPRGQPGARGVRRHRGRAGVADHGPGPRSSGPSTGCKLAESTATGEAIFAALQSIETFSQAVVGAPSDGPPPARIVLMTDGKQTVPGPDGEDEPRGAFTAARKAAEAKVPVSTISFGTDYGSIEIDGERTRSPVDDASMREIAELSGGAVLHRGDRERAAPGLRRAGRADRLRDAAGRREPARG